MKRTYRQKELRKRLEIPKASYSRYVHNLENLSGLLDEENKINELYDDLQETWYDT